VCRCLAQRWRATLARLFRAPRCAGCGTIRSSSSCTSQTTTWRSSRTTSSAASSGRTTLSTLSLPRSSPSSSSSRVSMTSSPCRAPTSHYRLPVEFTSRRRSSRPTWVWCLVSSTTRACTSWRVRRRLTLSRCGSRAYAEAWTSSRLISSASVTSRVISYVLITRTGASRRSSDTLVHLSSSV